MAEHSSPHQDAPRALAPLGFLLQSVLCQGIALGCVVGAQEICSAVAPVIPMGGRWAAATLIGVQALIAWAIARGVKLPPVWQLFNLVIVPGIAILASFEVPTLPLSILVFLVALLYLPTFWTRVPYYPTSVETYAEVARHLPSGRGFTCVDLGCGFGPLLRFLARGAPEGRFLGVEISPLAFVVAFLGSIPTHNIRIRYRSMWSLDLGAYDVVYAFLAPGPMPELWAKVEREMRPGSIFISNTFPAPAPADQVIEIPDRRSARLFLYRIAAKSQRPRGDAA